MDIEQRRLLTLEQYEVMDTLPEKEFDDIVELACAVCDVPISLITLLDARRQWFKAKVGLEDKETPIEHAFCAHAIQQPEETMVVPDSFKDERFKNNPLATGHPHVRFYAGAPLVTSDGIALGTLCVIDNQPRNFTPEQDRILKILAGRVIKQLELRKELLHSNKHIERIDKQLALTADRLQEVQRLGNVGCWDWDLISNELYWSEEMYGFWGIQRADGQTAPDNWQNKIHPDDLAAINEVTNASIQNGLPVFIDFRVKQPSGKEVWLHSQGTVVKNKQGKPIRFAGAVLDITSYKIAEAHKAHYTTALEEMLNMVSHKFRKPVANCLGLANVMTSVKLDLERTNECAVLLKEFASELDGHIHEVNSFLEQKRIKIAG